MQRFVAVRHIRPGYRPWRVYDRLEERFRLFADYSYEHEAWKQADRHQHLAALRGEPITCP